MREPALPPELWCKIFEFSCTDGGYTGQSLSLASKYFNALSKPYKFQSISLANMKYTFRFLEVLANTPPSFRRIRYLQVGYDSNLCRAAYNVQSNWDSASEYDCEALYSKARASGGLTKMIWTMATMEMKAATEEMKTIAEMKMQAEEVKTMAVAKMKMKMKRWARTTRISIVTTSAWSTDRSQRRRSVN
ncbi:hypothetical protein BDN72DRAFT_330560 [Pluteus cervinus]|uniref:Uncharacterized protein n=1 Tax=Pluteus cervinus TaxID=181527 RepID=A0ACD3ACL5_9AGAR|nr:hypothetical protein BDN72DRAFT_330560 [Pluteus cervinus]